MIARNTDMVIAAESMKQLYDEYIRAGFSDKQALYLLRALMENNK
jgi:hypothetical protein